MPCVTRLAWEQVLVPSEMNWQSLVPTLWAASTILSIRLGQIRLTLITGQKHRYTITHTLTRTHTLTETEKSTHQDKQQLHTHNQSLEDQEPIQIENLAHTQAPRSGRSFRMSKHFPHEG